MGDDTSYAGAKNPPSPYANKNAQTPVQAPKPLPVVNLVFFVLSSVTKPKIADFLTTLVTWARVLWKPKDDDLKKYEVNLLWDQTFKPIPDQNKTFRRIDFLKSGSPAALQLVKNNYSNPDFKPAIPIFIVEAAWDELFDGGQPHDGNTRGYTLVKFERWFTGERAVLIFACCAQARTLAHELTHWVGFIHTQYRDDPSNLAAVGGGGVQLDRDEFRKLHKWATDVEFRKQLAGK